MPYGQIIIWEKKQKDISIVDIKLKQRFLALASKNHYDRLHKLGFKTFNGVIDESFVSLDTWEKREQQIVNEVERLIALDSDQMVKDIQKTLDYNIKHFWKLWENYSEDTTKKVDKFIDQLGAQA